MKCAMRSFTLLLYVLSGAVLAENPGLEKQLAEVNVKIEQEKVINTELKQRLAARELEMSDLKSRLENVEDQIAALKAEHHL